jgi:type I restriction enzyme S subunit
MPYLTGPADFPRGVISQTKFTTHPSKACRAGDILVTVKGSGSGTLVRADATYCISRQLMSIRPSRWDPSFLYYSLLQNAGRIKEASTGLIPGLSRSDILGQRIPVPSSPAEQNRLAAALRDADDLITTLERLVAKKQAIKQGMLQQLLTGRTRLPEFNSEWQHLTTLGAVCTFENGDRGVNYPSPDSFVPYGIPFVNAGHLDAGQIRFENMDYITEQAFDRLGSGKFNRGDILFCLRGSLGKFGIVTQGNGGGAIASSLVIVRPKSGHLTTEYLRAYFGSELCTQQIEKGAGGGAQPNLGAGDLARFAIPLPSVVEQRAIAKVLADADAEISVLQTRLAKGRNINTGMMQELLTGRTRLPIQEVAS